MAPGTRLGLDVPLAGSEVTLDCFCTPISGNGAVTVKPPIPRSVIVPSTPSVDVTRAVQAPTGAEPDKGMGVLVRAGCAIGVGKIAHRHAVQHRGAVWIQKRQARPGDVGIAKRIAHHGADEHRAAAE
jgi:hypothetical protein